MNTAFAVTFLVVIELLYVVVIVKIGLRVYLYVLLKVHLWPW